MIKIGVINVSDRASTGAYEDIPGQAVVGLLREWLTSPSRLDYKGRPRCAAGDRKELRRMAIKQAGSLVITTGGTGPGARDVTPEATLRVCQKLLPRVWRADARASLHHVPTAILRARPRVSGKDADLNLPGRPKAIRENLEAVFSGHSLLRRSDRRTASPTPNEALMPAFRPKA